MYTRIFRESREHTSSDFPSLPSGRQSSVPHVSVADVRVIRPPKWWFRQDSKGGALTPRAQSPLHQALFLPSRIPTSSSFSCGCPAAAAAKSHQSCPMLCDPVDRSPPGSSVPGILQARTLERVAISFSNAWKSKVKMKSLSRVRLLTSSKKPLSIFSLSSRIPLPHIS